MVHAYQPPICSQVMDNAITELTKCYKKSKFDGHGIAIHSVPHDTESLGYDHYREGMHAVEKSMLVQPKHISDGLRREYKSFIEHCSSGLYRIEFKRCQTQGCTLCQDHRERDCPLNDFLRRFPNNQVPAPVPIFPPFPREIFDKEPFTKPSIDVNTRLEQYLVPIDPKGATSSAEGFGSVRGHYRTFGDLLQSPLPKSSLTYASDYYRGHAKRIPCTDCREPYVLRSNAAYNRHCVLVHGSNVPIADDHSDSDGDLNELDSGGFGCESWL